MSISDYVRIAALSICLTLAPGCQQEAQESRTTTTLQPIIGGQPDPGHQAVGYLSLSSGGCSGTLVAPTIVLTAAHCVYEGAKPKSFTMYGPDGSQVEKIKVKKGIHHPLYNSWEAGDDYSAYDLALVVLNEPAAVAPIPIRTRPLDCLAGTPLTFVGFGLTDASDYNSAGSKEFVQSAISQVDEFTFTAGTTPGDPSCPCFGDSGGPALVSVGERTEVIGIISSGDWWCAQEDTLVRVDSHLDWILEIMLEQAPEGLPGDCGDGWCDLCEVSQGCPADCLGGPFGAGEECEADAECAAPLHCRSHSGASICGELCPDPVGGTGCPCGFICTQLDVPGENIGLCIASGYPDSSCGNGACEPGESDLLCPPDCTALPCHEVSTAGCCANDLAMWCEGGVLHQQHCAGDLECGWSGAASRYACGTDGSPDPSGLAEPVCPALGPKCGDGHCQPGEDTESCFVDCPLPGYCGDGECGGYEYYANCPEDCLKDKCEVFAGAGCCQGDTVIWCTQFGQYEVSCGPVGGCGWSEYDMYYTCGPMIIYESPWFAYPRKCEEYPHEMVCGDGECNGSEDYKSCPADCIEKGCQFDAPDGCCDGTTVKYCLDGQQLQVSCTPHPECGWHYSEEQYVCGTYGETDPSGIRPKSCSEYSPFTCGDGLCQNHESSEGCPEDCPAWGDCENGLCGPGEDHDNCPQDCVYDGCEFVPPQACCMGNLVQYCEGGQTLMVNCSDNLECGWLDSSGYYWCGTDGGVDPARLLPRDCATYINPHCGDGWCHENEDSDWCPADCPPPLIGDTRPGPTGDATSDAAQEPDAPPPGGKQGCSASLGNTSAYSPACLALLLALVLVMLLPRCPPPVTGRTLEDA